MKKITTTLLGLVFVANLLIIPAGAQTANALVYNVAYPTGFGTGYSSSGVVNSSNGGTISEAQYAYPTSYYGSTGTGYPATNSYTGAYSGACVNLSRTLSYGVTGSDVSSLQQFLINQGLLSTGLITGYFGGATMKAVETFQYDHDIPATGTVGTETIQAIQVVSCGGTSGGYGGTYPGTVYPTYPTYPSGYYGAAPIITSLSSSSGYPGQQVTIYGSGFDPYNNTVTFAGQTESGIASINGTQLTFAVPYLNSGCSSSYVYGAYPYTNCSQPTYQYQSSQSYQVTVSDSRGISNPIQFTLIANGNTGCTIYSPYSGCGNYGIPPYGTNGTPSITYITPTIGGIGTLVTIYGSGFSYTSNTVHIGAGELLNVGSSNGSTISLTLPQYLNGFCQPGVYCSQYAQTLTPGSYSIYVTSSSGYNSNTEPFTVSNGGVYGGTGSLSISNLNGPTTLSLGQNGVWTLTAYDQTSGYLNTSVNWGDGQYNAENQSSQYYSSGQSQTLSFSHAYESAGTFTITFTITDSAGNTTTASQTVYIP